MACGGVRDRRVPWRPSPAGAATTSGWRCDYVQLALRLRMASTAIMSSWRCDYVRLARRLRLAGEATTSSWRCDYFRLVLRVPLQLTCCDRKPAPNRNQPQSQPQPVLTATATPRPCRRTCSPPTWTAILPAAHGRTCPAPHTAGQGSCPAGGDDPCGTRRSHTQLAVQAPRTDITPLIAKQQPLFDNICTPDPKHLPGPYPTATMLCDTWSAQLAATLHRLRPGSGL
eukprot:355981-Chlamydomonas_euryale.AAC.1